MATGIPDKMFNSALIYILREIDSAVDKSQMLSTSMSFKLSYDAQGVLSFLDMFFQGDINRA